MLVSPTLPSLRAFAFFALPLLLLWLLVEMLGSFRWLDHRRLIPLRIPHLLSLLSLILIRHRHLASSIEFVSV